MTIWRMWVVGQIDASIAVLVLLAIAQLGRHRLSPTVRSVMLLIALIRLALPPFIQSPWSEAAVDLPPLDDTRTMLFGVLQDDRAQYAFGFAAAVSLLLLARLTYQLQRSYHLVIAESVVAPEWVQLRAQALAPNTALQVRIADDRHGPFAAGIRKRLIVLPASLLDALDHQAMDAALAHEIAHHERRDLVWLSGVKALQAIAWFNPLTHLLAYAIRSAREDGSDDWAMSHTSAEPFAYAHALLQSARLVAMNPRGILAAGAHPLDGRLRRLLDADAARDRRPGLGGVVLILIVTALAIPGAHTPNLSNDDDQRIVIVIRR
jgi:beta-lactamase regulating signal transducer with metallopeptidase domain